MRFVPDLDPSFQHSDDPFQDGYSDTSYETDDEEKDVVSVSVSKQLEMAMEELGLGEHYKAASELKSPESHDSFTPTSAHRTSGPANSRVREDKAGFVGAQFTVDSEESGDKNEGEPNSSHKAREAKIAFDIRVRMDSRLGKIESILAERRRVREERAEKLRREAEEAKRCEEEKKRQEEEARRKEEELERKEQERLRKEEEERAAKKAQEEAEKAQKEKEMQEHQAQELVRKEEEKRLRMEAAKKEAESKKSSYNFEAISAEFVQYKQDILDIKADVVEAMNKDKDLKKLVNQHKRKINPKFGQLTHTLPQLRKITSEIVALVEQTKNNILVFKWILNFMAKAIVSQAETEVTVSPGASLPLGMLALHLTIVFPEFRYFLMARFVKKCPYVIGYTCDIDTDEGRIRMGWKRSSDQRWEAETKYNERVGGICTLFSAMTRLRLDPSIVPQAQGAKHPFPISHGWRLVSRMLNLPLNLLQNTHFVIANDWWDASAAEFVMAYGKQANKILELMTTEWVASVADRRYPGAARLVLQKEELASTGKCKSFKPMDAYE
ncbi:unnamed protein product [Kuraishia capsulata CBS 1993]|uniref:mRNA export factor GLE1 n=1 Tax=Kuraishia capsulata CBS 1993 TaxID=1382522 RepID=W6MX48_9ASCO|nr:uncharacterized protein KUCA_T00004247001 [Kuraishia capsulata CBS 1993]CDK28265.1 unnamed protein product [Kuraishia capsulata CBS 1993]